MRNTSLSIWIATTSLVLSARALPRPHPVATYQVVDVGGPTSTSSASPEIVYETVAITKSSKPKTVTERPVTVTVTPTIFTSASTPLASSSISPSSSVQKQESAETPASYSTSIVKSPLPTIPLASSTFSFPATTTTSAAAYVPDAANTWTSAPLGTTTSVAVYLPPTTTSWSSPAAKTESPVIVLSPGVWSPTPMTAMHTVYETVYVAPSAYSPPAPLKSAFPAFIVPWNATHHTAKATLSASYGHSSGLSAAVARKTGSPRALYLAA